MHVPVNRVFNNVSRNLGLSEYTEHIDTWAEWAFEAEQYIGSLDTFLESEITYHLDAPEAATAEIKFETNALNKTYIEIGGTRFYFRNSSFSSFMQLLEGRLLLRSTFVLFCFICSSSSMEMDY